MTTRLLTRLRAWRARSRFSGSAEYWERRYQRGHDSGEGSGGELAAYKAEYLNAFVDDHGIRSVLELGSGDGRQLALARYPRYLGLDVSQTAVELCRRRLRDRANRAIVWLDPHRSRAIDGFLTAELALSLDVLYHLVEDHRYEDHLRLLFGASREWVIVYSSNEVRTGFEAHVKHRAFTRDVERWFPDFVLQTESPNPWAPRTHSRFFVFRRARG